MPYAPGVTDISGQLYAQGILGAMQNLSMGLERARQRNDEAKKLESENKALKLLAENYAQSVGLPPEMVQQMTASSATESPAQVNARLKQATTGILQQHQLNAEKARREAEVAKLAIEQGNLDVHRGNLAAVQQQVELAKRAQDRQDEIARRNQAAAAGALAPVLPSNAAVEGAFAGGMPVPGAAEPDGQEAMRRYLSAGGNDPQQSRMLIDAAKPRKGAGFATADEALGALPAGTQGQVMMNSEGRWVAQGSTRDGGTEQIKVGDRTLTYHKDSKKYFDAESGKPVQFGQEYTPRPPDPLMKAMDPELYQAQREEYLRYVKAGGGGRAEAPAGAKAAQLTGKDKEAYAWAKANPTDPRAKQILTRLGLQ